MLLLFAGAVRAEEPDGAGVEYFEKKIRPVLVQHCYKCHSGESEELKGSLRLDVKAGWELGGESGLPAVLPGKPNDSPLIQALRHDDAASPMPPNQSRLTAAVIQDFEHWVKIGAPDPRRGTVQRIDKVAEWEETFRQRLDWWSLKPLRRSTPPRIHDQSWPRNDVDRFILAELEAAGFEPNPPADRQALTRRLAFTLTGLPPDPQLLSRFAADDSSQAYDHLVTALLDSPHFGERWARHWMDVVHYADTHGYEWDVPAKGAWRYRDYLIRAFNADIPYRQMILEQLAGDLIEPRVDASTGLIESRVGPMMLRLGERRHGDNADVGGVTQEAVANMIDTLGKAFLGTTLACAQCHDHKLDAVEQSDYYALAGVFMSTRFPARPVDAIDPNLAAIEKLRSIKQALRKELARLWLHVSDPAQPGGTAAAIQAIKPGEIKGFPTSLETFWQRSLGDPVTTEAFQAERERRIAANAAHLKLLADFTPEDGAPGWRWEGFGMQHGLAVSGEPVIAMEGDMALQQILPAGRFSHVWSQRLAGSLQSPEFDVTQPMTFSIGLSGGKFASQSFIVDRALNSERLKYIDSPQTNWKSFTAGGFKSLEGSIDRVPRRVYLAAVTKALDNYFPPRVGYGGLTEKDVADPRSWFGVTKVYQHAPGQGPQDELARFAPLFDPVDASSADADWSIRLTRLLHTAVQRWADGNCSDEDARLLNDALQSGLLPNQANANEDMARLVNLYRQVEQTLVPDRTVGSVAEYEAGQDERLAIRGSYTDLGERVPRGTPRFFREIGLSKGAEATHDSGRLELARSIASPQNPLTARVYVNRVWHYLFGSGLVRTPDDFGHLGEPPRHSELLDYLANRFMEEGWSTKKLIRLLVTSATWKQSSVPRSGAHMHDPENRLWHHMPLRRLEAEAIRDSMLAVSGCLDAELYGPPIEPFRTAEDAQKRLFCGPLDGAGRRSIYLEMTLMEPPRFLALFNQPIPKQTVGRRDVTNVPDQALALLNDPFVIEMARRWSQKLLTDGAASPEERIANMLEHALARPASSEEITGLARLVRQTGKLRGVPGNLMRSPTVWQDAAHATFNLKEFLYVP